MHADLRQNLYHFLAFFLINESITRRPCPLPEKQEHFSTFQIGEYCEKSQIFA